MIFSLQVSRSDNLQQFNKYLYADYNKTVSIYLITYTLESFNDFIAGAFDDVKVSYINIKISTWV